MIFAKRKLKYNMEEEYVRNENLVFLW